MSDKPLDQGTASMTDYAAGFLAGWRAAWTAAFWAFKGISWGSKP